MLFKKPTPSQMNLIKSAKNHFLILKKYLKCPALPGHYLDKGQLVVDVERLEELLAVDVPPVKRVGRHVGVEVPDPGGLRFCSTTIDQFDSATSIRVARFGLFLKNLPFFKID